MKPSIPLTNPAFKYTNAASTDVQTTWRQHGWTAINPFRKQFTLDDAIKVVNDYIEEMEPFNDAQHFGVQWSVTGAKDILERLEDLKK